MPRTKKVYHGRDPFIRTPEITVDNKKIVRGDIIKIHGIHGTKFKFLEHVLNPENGAEWIDCIELERDVACGMRSFRPDRVKRIPKKRVKRDSRKRLGETP